jgi:hypothetical protein
MHRFTRTHACTYIHTIISTQAHTNINAYTCIHVCLCVCICMYVHIYMCVCIYIYIYILQIRKKARVCSPLAAPEGPCTPRSMRAKRSLKSPSPGWWPSGRSSRCFLLLLTGVAPPSLCIFICLFVFRVSVLRDTHTHTHKHTHVKTCMFATVHVTVSTVCCAFVFDP